MHQTRRQGNFEKPIAGMLPRFLSLPQLAARYGSRYSSHAAGSYKSNTIHDMHNAYLKGVPLTMCTAHDYITANWVHEANCDMLLVGDSLSMTSLGYDSTTDLPFDEFKYHVRSVCRAHGPSMVVVDMPFGSFEASTEQGLSNAIEVMKLSSKVTSLKLEVGLHTRDSYTINLIKEICSRGIPVMGHIGLTPQKAHSLGGFKVQGNKTLNGMVELQETALLLQEAGCWSLLIECVPHKLAQHLTSRLSIPTIGIGAGSGTSGQVLVVSDLLGMKQGTVPKFVKQYSHVCTSAVEGIRSYNSDVQEGRFPDKDIHTFKIKDDLWKSFIEKSKQL